MSQQWTAANIERDARELANLLGLAHRRLDERDQERGTFVPAHSRPRHTPRHHPAWWKTQP